MFTLKMLSDLTSIWRIYFRRNPVDHNQDIRLIWDTDRLIWRDEYDEDLVQFTDEQLDELEVVGVSAKGYGNLHVVVSVPQQ